MMTTELDLEGKAAIESLNILLIGNNPIEMSSILEKINQVRTLKINVAIAFNLRTVLVRLIEFDPHYILIDDNIGKSELKKALHVLLQNG